jgi:hypothetical protein
MPCLGRSSDHSIDDLHNRIKEASITGATRDSRPLVETDKVHADVSAQLKRFGMEHNEEVFFEYTRATNSSNPVEYDDNHPYEIIRRRRRMKESGNYDESEEEEERHQSFMNRHLQAWDETSEYKSMRLSIDTKYLLLVRDIYGPEVDYLETVLLPRVQKIWQDALRVYPVSNNLVVTSADCPISSLNQNTTGIPNSDLVILVAANLDTICSAATEPLVAATSCQYDVYDRPTVGRATICLQDLDITNEYSTESLYKLLVHGFAHILGFSHKDYQFYYNPETGEPRTSRPFVETDITCVDGGQQNRVVPSRDTIQSGFTSRGLRYFELVTPTVRTIARNQFDCPIMTGARLENQPTNNGNCFGSHWEAVSINKYIFLFLLFDPWVVH